MIERMDRVRVLLLNSDNGGCGSYRMLFPMKALAHDANLTLTDGNAKFIATDHDVVVMQKPMHAYRVDAIPELQKRGVAVVVEVDDDYWDLDRRNPAWRDGRLKQDYNVKHLWRACELADLVIVSTPALATLLPNKNTRVLRNCVPEWYLSVEPDPLISWEEAEGKLIVGWTGDIAFHPGDLKQARYSVPKVVRDTNSIFIGIGSEGIGPELGFADAEARYIGFAPLARYPSVIAGLNVGLVPLEDSRFNTSKSWLKGLEYASLGVPFIASPRAEYVKLKERGAGLLAAKPRDWMSQLRLLLENDEARKNEIEINRTVARELTYEKNAHRWAEAWQDAVKIRRNT